MYKYSKNDTYSNKSINIVVKDIYSNIGINIVRKRYIVT